MSREEVKKILMDAHDNDLTRIHINHDDIQHEIKNARWDCAEKIRKVLKILESEPEPGEFTKQARFQLDEGTLPITKLCLADDNKYHIPRDIVNYYHEACDIIDRLSADLKAKDEEIERLRAEVEESKYIPNVNDIDA